MSPPAPATLEDRARLTNYLRSRIRQDRSAPHRYPMATDGVMGARQFVLGFPSLAGIKLVNTTGAAANLTGKKHGPLQPTDGSAAATLEQFAGRNTTKAGQGPRNALWVEDSVGLTLHELLQCINHQSALHRGAPLSSLLTE